METTATRPPWVSGTQSAQRHHHQQLSSAGGERREESHPRRVDALIANWPIIAQPRHAAADKEVPLVVNPPCALHSRFLSLGVSGRNRPDGGGHHHNSSSHRGRSQGAAGRNHPQPACRGLPARIPGSTHRQAVRPNCPLMHRGARPGAATWKWRVLLMIQTSGGDGFVPDTGRDACAAREWGHKRVDVGQLRQLRRASHQASQRTFTKR